MPLSKEQITAIRKEEYEPFRNTLDVVENIFDGDHRSWWFRTMLFLHRLQRSIKKNPEAYTSQNREYASTLITLIISYLAAEVTTEGEYVQRAHENILAISDHIPKGLEVETKPVHVRSLTLEDLTHQTDRVTLIEESTSAGTKVTLRVCDSKNQSYDFPLPTIDGIYHKGGLGRVLVKILAQADDALIDAELPPNDIDIIADTNLATAAVEEEAHRLAVDPDGIEYVASLDFERLFLERDLDINMVFVGKDGIHFAQEAVDAAESGRIQVMSAHRGIYGTEVFVYDGQILLKNRGVMRLFKTVVEGKATHFEFTPLNENISFGIYWLVLFRRFLSKESAAVYLDRLFEIAKKTNQIPTGTTNIIEVLDVMHEKYPFFDFDAASLNDVGVARWLGKKLLRQIDASYRHTHKIPNELTIERKPGDTIPYRVDLDDYVANKEKILWIETEIPRFLDRCRQRTRAFKEASNSALQYESD